MRTLWFGKIVNYTEYLASEVFNVPIEKEVLFCDVNEAITQLISLKSNKCILHLDLLIMLYYLLYGKIPQDHYK